SPYGLVGTRLNKLVKLPGKFAVPPLSPFSTGSNRCRSACNTNNARKVSRVTGIVAVPCGSPAAAGTVRTGGVLKREPPVGIAVFTPRFVAKLVARFALKLPGADVAVPEA